MKIVLSTEKVKEFLEKAKLVPTDKGKLMPMMLYLKIGIEFGACTITKVNERGFIQMDFPVDGVDDCDDFIIEESKLIAFCDTTESKTITLMVEGDKVTIKDKFFTQKNVPISDHVSTYPALPEINKEVTRITKDTIELIDVAKNFISKDTLRPHFCALYIKDNLLFSSNANIVYLKTIQKNVPDLTMGVLEANAIQAFPYVDFNVSGNFNTYKHSNTIYGFRHTEGTDGWPFQQFLDCRTKENYLTIKRDDFLKFCKYISKFPEGGSARCKIEILEGSKEARIFYDNIETGDMNEIIVPVEVVGDNFDVVFLVNIWTTLLSSITNNVISISNAPGFVPIWTKEDENLDCFVGKITQE